MTVEERAWLAGLLEGEGSFWLERRTERIVNGVTIPEHETVVVEVKMIDRDVIDRVAELLDRTVVTRHMPEGRQTQYRVRVTGPRARQLMSDLRPLMGRRRQDQIDRAIN